MGFTRRIKYYLVHGLGLSNREAGDLIRNGQVQINGVPISTNVLISDTDEIKVKGRICREGKKLVYLKFYKPVGFQSSLNAKVSDSLAAFFTDHPPLAIAGRLDKASEGLLLLSNDGQWVEKLCHPRFEKEKEYIVKINKEPDREFIRAFSGGVKIGREFTAPCFCERREGNYLRIILKEGKNRQIRRMCLALGYRVEELKRVRISKIQLGSLKPGQAELLTGKEV